MSALRLFSLSFLVAMPSVALAQATPEIPPPPPPAPAASAGDQAKADPPAPPSDKKADAPAPQSPPPPAPQPAAPAPKKDRAQKQSQAPRKAPAPVFKKKNKSGRLSVTPSGETGLMNVASAEAMQPGLIRLGFGLDFFTVGSLFRDNDNHSRVGGTLSISGSPTDYVELWLNTRAASNSNDFVTPKLLQSLGDLQLGVKAFYPVAKIATVGLDLQWTMLTGVGSSSLELDASQLRTRLLLTTDLMKTEEKIPLRMHLNVGYIAEGSSKLIAEGEELSDAERFGLGINDFNRVALGLGVEVPVKYVTPYLEYNIQFPLDYLSTPGVVIGASDSNRAGSRANALNTLALPAYGKVMPQWLTPGIRVTALPDLTVDLAIDIGLTPEKATGVPAIPDYNVWFMASYVIDPFNVRGLSGGGSSGPPVVVPVIVPEVIEQQKDTGLIAGLVRNKNDQKPIEGAVISFEGSTPVASAADGRFVSQDLALGPVKMTVKKDGFESGEGQLEVQPSQTGEVLVELVPEVRAGKVSGLVSDESGAPLGSVALRVMGAKTAELTTDSSGRFQTELEEGEYSIVVDTADFLRTGRAVSVEKGGKHELNIKLAKRGKKLASIKGNRVQTPKPVLFAKGETALSAETKQLLDLVVDAILGDASIKTVEVGAHTDSRGNADDNLQVSKARAEAVRKYLESMGVPKSKLTAQGYGSSRPAAPNLTRRGRSQNRRVEFMVQR